MNQTAEDPRHVLSTLFDAAIQAAQPAHCMAPHIPPPPRGRLIVVGAGKASAAMAQAFERLYLGELSGSVVTRDGYAVPTSRIEVLTAAHPISDEASIFAARCMKQLVQGLTTDDLVVALLSGGGSALLEEPADGISLADIQSLNHSLLRSGASIHEMNCVRRHLSSVKGGRLAALCHPARVLTLLISDVPGDDPWNISSGPTVADPTTCGNALAILENKDIEIPLHVRQVLTSGEGETIKPEDPRVRDNSVIQIAGPQLSLEAAAKRAREHHITPYILSSAIEGEAREVAKAMAGMALQVARYGQPFSTPCVLLSGGETTVTVRGQGRGGRNVEFLLALAIALQGQRSIYALAGDTDGVDGQEEIAGAYIAPDTLVRAEALKLRPNLCLINNDAHRFFSTLGDAVLTGPTLTNVNDFRAILIR